MTQPLLDPFLLGNLVLPSRVVMAAMTRARADNPDSSLRPEKRATSFGVDDECAGFRKTARSSGAYRAIRAVST